jgi:hypothetical protein
VAEPGASFLPFARTVDRGPYLVEKSPPAILSTIFPKRLKLVIIPPAIPFKRMIGTAHGVINALTIKLDGF